MMSMSSDCFVLIERAEADRVDRLLAGGLEVEPRRSAVLIMVIEHLRQVARVEHVLREHFV